VEPAILVIVDEMAEHGKARREKCRAFVLMAGKRGIRLISTVFCSLILSFRTCPIRRVGIGSVTQITIRSNILTQLDIVYLVE
jgi:hypothetical protein